MCGSVEGLEWTLFFDHQSSFSFGIRGCGRSYVLGGFECDLSMCVCFFVFVLIMDGSRKLWLYLLKRNATVDATVTKRINSCMNSVLTGLHHPIGRRVLPNRKTGFLIYKYNLKF